MGPPDRCESSKLSRNSSLGVPAVNGKTGGGATKYTSGPALSRCEASYKVWLLFHKYMTAYNLPLTEKPFYFTVPSFLVVVPSDKGKPRRGSQSWKLIPRRREAWERPFQLPNLEFVWPTVV